MAAALTAGPEAGAELAFRIFASRPLQRQRLIRSVWWGTPSRLLWRSVRNEHYAQIYFDTTRAIQEISVHV